MPSAASVVINRAKSSLNDPDSATWPESDLIDYINDAQYQVVMVRPESNPETRTVQLVEGTKQTLPTDAFSLIEVIRNMDGTTPGRAIRQASFYYIDKNYPDWHSSTPDNEVINYLYDTRNRKTFYVRPGQTSSPESVELVLSRIPAKVTAAGDTLTLEEVYEPSILAWVMYRAFLKEVAMDGATMEKANSFLAQFVRTLEVRQQADMRQHPGNEMQTVLQDRGY